MTTMFDLMQAFHDIDRLKGRVCSRCEFFSWQLWAGWDRPVCSRGGKPLGGDDGCEDWQAKPDREAQALAAVIGSL